VIDLKDAFSQVPMDEASQEYAAFWAGGREIFPLCMTQGLKNAPAVWQRIIEHVLADVRDVADPYIDDIIVCTKRLPGDSDEDLHRRHRDAVWRVLEALESAKLVADKKKSTFFAKVVEFCGHRLSQGKREPAPGKLMALQKWPLPTTVTALRGFLGFTNYYSEYVPHYAEHVALLQDKLKLPHDLGKKNSQHRLKYTQE
jgi:hypothetical protein